MKILYVAKLSNSKLQEKLTPLLASSVVETIYVLRDTRGNAFDDRVIYLSPKKKHKGVLRHIFKIIAGVRFCKEYGIDVIIGVLNTPHGYIGKCISFFTRRPYIHVTIAGAREFYLEGRLAEKLNCCLFKSSSAITVTGLQTKRYLIGKDFKADKIFILPNVTDSIFMFLTNIPPLKDRAYDIVSISRIDKNKNFELLLKAIAYYKESYPLKTLIVGDGEELENVKSLVSELRINHLVEFYGYASGVEEKINIYKQGKMFVSTSKGEGFPVAMLEAMCCGCIPIVSNVGDVIDAIDNGVNGFFFNNLEDESELMSCLHEYINRSDKQQMSDEAKNIKLNYYPDLVTESWNNIFLKIKISND